MGEENGDISSDGMDPQDQIPAEDNGAGAEFATSVQDPRRKVKKGGLKQKGTRASRSFSMSRLKGMGKVQLLNLIKEA